MEVKKITKGILKEVFKKRKEKSHKGDFGRLLVIGGNEKYSGSPLFNALAVKAMSAYKSGVDIVEVASIKRVADIIAGYPEIITLPLSGKYLKKKHLKKLLNESKNKTAFVIGGGLGRKSQTLKTVREFLKKVNLPGVIDADAIYALNFSKKFNQNSKRIDLSNFIITPHSYEFSILTGNRIKNNRYNRRSEVQKAAEKLNTTILLKGHEDIISNGEEIKINTTGNPYMTVGGTGDILAGLAGSLIAQGNDLFLSASAASYINGKAGENTNKKASLIASDLLEEISKIVDSVQ